MRALLVVLLFLGLGALAVRFVLTGSSGGRGARTPSTPAEEGRGALDAPQDAPPALSQPQRSPPAPPDGRRPAAEAPAAGPTRAFLEGSVIGEGAPIVGANLELSVHGAARASATTDARGRFRIECEPLTTAALLRIRARGYVTMERTLPGRPAGGTVLLGNLRLFRGQRVEGRVVDVNGAGLSEAAIRVEPFHAQNDLQVAEARSGAGGRFEVQDAPPGTLLVSARARGFGEVSVTYTPGDELELRLEPGKELRLRLLTPQGRPVADATVSIQPREAVRAVKREKQSDAEGRVVFEDLAQPEWNVRVMHPEYRTNRPGLVQANGEEEHFECIPWPAIEGRVRAPGGQPLPTGTRVQALPASAPSDRVTVLEGGVEVAADGSFRIGGLRGGEWRVRATAPGFAPALSIPVKLGIEGTGYAGAIELASGGTLTLRLRRAGEPVAGAGLELFATEPSAAQMWAFATESVGSSRAARSDGEGLARFENQAPGTVWVAIYAEGSPPTRSGPHVIADGPSPSPIEIELVRGGRFVGSVRMAGRPLPHAQVRIVDRSGMLGFPLTLVCDEVGRYTSGWLSPGRFSLEAFPPENPRAGSTGKEVGLAAGEQKTVDLEL